ncbi:MAG TPA: desulfoferrodoxin [Candidatus Gemmiger avistercoris]|uniref:Desulfoferrodoxin n=1 Tax=Candidatus Gemmiger avistercoris TaxID=2838606 RepID=A0A9D2JR16_9FIRM|nr:desulfoferrodoxin family protein [uncultured Subdoligranulum sp.]HIZ62784.1 desulfoferrodoxin [Candidatus Gemmiger avistercoris]
MEQKYFICEHCGNIVTMVQDKGVPVFCCGQKMTPLVPGTVEAAHEKHIPVYTVEGNTVHVKVGSVDHPMLEEHFITWISLQTRQGSQIKYLKPGEAPAADFALTEGDAVEAVYAYCNLHGLWKA